MSPEARAVVLARLRELGCAPGLIADAEAGRVDPDDLLRWMTDYHAARAADTARWQTRTPTGQPPRSGANNGEG